MNIKHLKLYGIFALSLLSGSCYTNHEISMLHINIWQEGSMIQDGYEAIVNEIAHEQPDFVMLSEVRNYHNTRFCDRIIESLRQKNLIYHSFYSYDSGLLSRHPITDSVTIFPFQGDHGSIYKLTASLYGRRCAVYTAHLDYQNDTYYEVRGYNGNNWQKMEQPLTDTAEILRRNALSLRDEAIAAFLEDTQKEKEQGSLIFLGGDFNEPSHLDWTTQTRDSADHHGVVIAWPTTKALYLNGFKDAYRELYPNPVTHPGYTYPADNKDVETGKLSWAPDADERERIDYIFYYPQKGLKLTDVKIIGPKGCIQRNKRVLIPSKDPIRPPLDIWPSDHKGVWTKFLLKTKKM